MKTLSKENEINVGIDTSKDKLDIYIRPLGEYFVVENNQQGVKEAIRRIKPHKPTRVVIEATGRMELLFACEAVHIGHSISPASPLKSS